MRRRRLRLVLAMLVAVLLIGNRAPLRQAQAAAPSRMLAPLASLLVPTSRSYEADGQVVISHWPTAGAFFADWGVRMPQPFSRPLYIDPDFARWMQQFRPT